MSDAAGVDGSSAAAPSDQALFISYARQDDEPFVERLRDDLVAHGHRVWWDRASMESRGQAFLAEIRLAIETAQRVVLVVGPEARRPYVEVEWRHALRHGVVVTPVLRLGEYTDVPSALAALHCQDVRAHFPEAAALANVRRLLATPVLPQGPLIGVPRLASPFVARPDLLEPLRSRVLIDAYQPIDLEADHRITSLVGMGGVGKTVLATALAHDAEVRRAFPDGIVWIAVGKDADRLRTLIRLGLAIGDDTGRYTGVHEARLLLSRALEAANCLLVLDDIEDVGVVEAVHLAAGKRVRILMTSRHQRVFASSGVHTVPVDELADGPALELLAQWTETPVDELPPTAKEIIARCGNLPLALSMIGALIRGRPDHWGHALERLRRADLSKIGARLPDYQYEDLHRAMLVSFEDLEPDIRSRYLDLAAVPEDVAAPGGMLRHWWIAEGMDELAAVDTLDVLAERSLVRLHDDDSYTVHDVQRDFLMPLVDVTALHQRWLAAFRPPGTAGWHTAGDDRYLLDHLAHHMHGARHEEEWRDLLTSFEWLDRKAAARGFPAVLADLAAETDDGQIALIERTCRRAAHVLTNDLAQLPAQLLARLDPAEGGPAVARLLERARSIGRPRWLQPVTVSLDSTGDPVAVVFRGREVDGHAGTPQSIALSGDAAFIASGGGSSNDRTVKLWSIRAATLLRSFRDVMEAGHAALVAFVGADGLLAVAAGEQVNVHTHQADDPVARTAFPGRDVTRVCGALDDGTVIVGFRDGGVVRWSSAEDAAITLREPDGEEIVALAHAAAGARVVAATPSAVECRRSDDGALVDRVDLAFVDLGAHLLPVLEISADGSQVWLGDPPGRWTIGTAAIEPLAAGPGPVLAMTPDGGTALALSGENSYDHVELEVVRPATQTRVARMSNSRMISCLALSADGHVAVTADYEHDVKVWDLDQASTEQADWERRGRVEQVAITDDHALAVIRAVHATEAWDTTTGTPLGGSDAVNPERLVRRGVSLVDETLERDLREQMDAILPPVQAGTRRRSMIGPLAFTPAGGRAVTAPPLGGKYADMEEPIDVDGTDRPGGLWIWDLLELRATRQATGPAGRITCVSITPDGRMALTGSQGRVLRLWDLDTGRCVRSLRGHRGMVYGCALTDDARYAVSGSEDMTVRLWDLTTATLVFTFATASAVATCDIAANGSVAVAGELSGRVHLFAVHT